MPLQATVQQDLSRGSNLVSSPYVVGRQQSQLLTNLILDEHGSARTRDGTSAVTTAPRTDPIICLFDFRRTDGTVIKLAIQLGTGGGNNQLFRRDTVPWTLIGALGTSYQIPDILTFTNLALIVNGDEVPWCVDTETEALTRHGWRRYDQIELGAEILAYDAKTGRTRWAPMVDRYIGHFRGEATVARWHGRDIAVTTPEHRWWVERPDVAAREKTSEQLSRTRQTKRPDCNWGIPVAAALDADIPETIGDDFVRLVGWVVSEGSIRTCGRSSVAAVVYQSEKSPYWEEVNRLCSAFGAARRRLPQGEDVWGLPAPIGRLLIGALDAKPFKKPKWAWMHSLSLRQRQLLFETVCRGDGHKEKRWHLSQHQRSGLLADLQALLFTCGVPASCPPAVDYSTSPRTGKVSGGSSRLNELKNPYVRPAWRREPFDGTVWCPTVETGWWVARRNGLAYVTGNSYDATTLSHITASSGTLPNGGRHHTLHQGYYWLWGTDDATGVLDSPSSLRSSDLNDPLDWPNANQIFVDKDSGESAMGLGQFTIAESGISPSTTQILFKQFSAFQMTGVFGSTNPVFAIQRVKSDMGCVAPRTIRFAPGFGLIRLTHRGVALYDGVNDLLISEEIRPLLFGNEVYSGIDWTNTLGAYAVVVPNPPLYLLFAPASGTSLTRCFAYDLVRRAWTVLAYATSAACTAAIQTPGAVPLVLMGDYSAGKVRSIFNPAASDATSDDGVAITWTADLRPVFGSSPQQRAYFRRVIVKAYNIVASQLIAWVALFGPVITAAPLSKSGTLTAPAAVPPTQPGGSGYGVSPYGLLPYGDVVSGSEMDFTIDLCVKATNGRLLLSGEGPITLRGLEWHVSRGPLGRPTTTY